ncbi:magnesium chelatase subunit D [Methanobacterium aggregans]|nr:VWA domain-containing protein [Methanobacterium aggregans]MBP2045610.1 magnesium chelatase subunit D [Methanobacterium aggregans]
MKNFIFPFSAIVGQENVKKALILNAINPSIGGVLIKGDKGTGKTTAVRALADLLPSLKVVKGCPFNCNPEDPDSLCESCRSGDFEVEEKKMRVVELPLGSTEDRVVGSINIEKALKEGSKALEPGILADANRNILYVDEINLLDDNLVDVLLDAAAYGVNIVEREGISIAHPSRFILVGTMNPAEGELRPQLSDRIGLHISVHSIMDLDKRVQIMERREEFEKDPAAFRDKFQEKQEEILGSIVTARKVMGNVSISKDLMKVIAHICMDMGVDGHRADIAILKTAKTVAAYQNMEEVNQEHVEEAALLVLGERFHKSSQGPEKIKEKVQKAVSDISEDKKQGTGQNQQNSSEGKKRGMKLKSLEKEDEKVEADEEGPDLKKLLKMKGKKKRRLYGKRVDSKTQKGKYVKSKLPKDAAGDIAIDATLRAAALKSAGTQSKGARMSLKVESDDLRHKVRKHGARASIVLVVDISGSMFTERKANRVKGILNRVIEDANRHNDKVSVVGFKGEDAEIIIPTTRRAGSFKEQVDNITVGGTTPLASGLKKGFEILKKEKMRDEYVPMMLVMTDGMPNVAIEEGPTTDALNIAGALKENEIHTIVINFEKSVKYGRNMNMELALASGGRYYDLEELQNPEDVVPEILRNERREL